MLVELQLAVTEGSIAETNIQKREINQSPKKIIKEIEDRRSSKKTFGELRVVRTRCLGWRKTERGASRGLG